MSTIYQEYIQSHPRSSQMYDQSCRLFPDGVTHEARYLLPFPIYIDHARGPRKWDVDGNEYIGYAMGHGSLILGHCHPEIVKEVQGQVERGTHLGFNTQLELRWAGAIRKLMPSIEKIRFHSSGTEATLMAFRLARAYTGKNKLIRLTNHYHGWHDYVAAGPDGGWPIGVPAQLAETIMVLPADRIDLVEEELRKESDIAALILEPTGAKAGALALEPTLLTQLREITRHYGVVLIFDEVVTGFRISPGGAQERHGVRPDLTTLAKIMAGGFPGGAVGGRAEILDMIARQRKPGENIAGRIYHPGTYNANPVSAAAGSKCLEILSREPINRKAEEAGRRLRDGLNTVMKKRGITGFSHGYGSLIFVVFGMAYNGDLDICSAPKESILRSIGSERTQVFRRAMLNNGVDVMSGHQFILSATHGEREIEETIAAFEKSLYQMQKEGLDEAG